MENSRVQVIDRAMDLIELLATSENGLSITELSAATGLPKSTIHRILSTYTQRHYVEKNQETSIYSLGHKFVEIASIYLNKVELKTEAAPYMHEMVAIFGHTSYLGILENNEVMYLERADQFNSLRLYTQIGKRAPLYCTALGKVLMAFLPEDQADHIARQLPYRPLTPNTIASYAAFREEIAQVRRRGYATDHCEHEAEISCLAVPIYDYTRKVVAAMSISGCGLFEAHSEQYLFAKMHDAAMRLSNRMGYSTQT